MNMYIDYIFICCNIDVNEFRFFKFILFVKQVKVGFYVLSNRCFGKVWFKSINRIVFFLISFFCNCVVVVQYFDKNKLCDS